MQYYGVSDIGRKRKENQDRICLPNDDSELKLFILADGMGGANAGSVASSTAIDFIQKYIAERWNSITLEREEIEKLIDEAISEANNFVYSKSKSTDEYAGMGTTIIVAITFRNKVYIGHIGDSRLYRVRKNIIRQLTRDHSYVEALVQSGSITKEEAKVHPQKNVLLKVLGCEENVKPDIITKGFLKGDVLLICSDGLTNMLETDEIYDVILENINNPKLACQTLIERANSEGGYDNISVILVYHMD